MLTCSVQRIAGPFFEPVIRFELQGAHHPRLVADSNQHSWVLKRLPPRGILAEAIGALLGRELGVPIPNFGHFDEADIGRGWLSSFVQYANHWQRARAHDLENFEDLGAMIVLDAIIHNEDRNSENIIFEPLEDSDSFCLWAIDTEAALVSRPREFASKGLACPSPFALPSDLSPAGLEGSIAHATSRAKKLPDVTLAAIVRAAAEAAGTRDGDILCEALRVRCRGAEEIVKDYLRQWARS